MRKPVKLGADVEAGPAFEVQTEDGLVTGWLFFVRVETQDGAMLTYRQGLKRSAAERLRDRVDAAGTVDPTYWTTRGPWDAYADEGTLEERLAPMGPEWRRERAEER